MSSTATEMPFGMSAYHVRVLDSSPGSISNSRFLIMYTLSDSRGELQQLCPSHSCGRQDLVLGSWLRLSAVSVPEGHLRSEPKVKYLRLFLLPLPPPSPLHLLPPVFTYSSPASSFLSLILSLLPVFPSSLTPFTLPNK